MKKQQNLDEYDPVIYPRTLWVTEFSADLGEQFTFYQPDCETTRDFTKMQEFIDTDNTVIMLTCPVVRKSDDKCGVIVIVVGLDYVEPGSIAHESVHVTDYIFQQLGINSEDFSQGNEHYAYLVDWCSNCIDKTIQKLKQRTKDDTK